MNLFQYFTKLNFVKTALLRDHNLLAIIIVYKVIHKLAMTSIKFDETCLTCSRERLDFDN